MIRQGLSRIENDVTIYIYIYIYAVKVYWYNLTCFG